MPSFYLFKTFTLEVKQMWHMYKYVLKHAFRQRYIYATYRNVVFRDHILTLSFYTVQCTYASLNTNGIKFIKLIIV